MVINYEISMFLILADAKYCTNDQMTIYADIANTNDKCGPKKTWGRKLDALSKRHYTLIYA